MKHFTLDRLLLQILNKAEPYSAFFVSLGMKKCWISTLALILSLHSFAQITPVGFHPQEYIDLLDLGAKSYAGKDSCNTATMLYRSPEVGLKNIFDVWLRPDQTAVICIRGTVQHASSWLENFYAAMTPAIGKIQVNDSTTFTYKFAEDPKAAVHVGWTIGLAHMAPEMVSQIKKLYTEKNVKNIIIFGHSQGGALSFLATSYLYYLQLEGGLPKDISFKTYCSAAPKPGNLYYAYDYDYITRNGKSYTVVNAADWVPESAFSIQTLDDFNGVNPFTNIKPALKKQKMLVRWYLNGVYNKLDKGSAKANKRFSKFLGKKLYPQVKKYLPQLKEPTYASSMNYMRAGVPIVLITDSTYHKTFDKPADQVFQHHLFEPYAWLVRKIYLQ